LDLSRRAGRIAETTSGTNQPPKKITATTAGLAFAVLASSLLGRRQRNRAASSDPAPYRRDEGHDVLMNAEPAHSVNESLARLIDAWCERTELRPLALILPAYTANNGLTDGWDSIDGGAS
jgi:hypothetical protein